jgi:hypothetical protein
MSEPLLPDVAGDLSSVASGEEHSSVKTTLLELQVVTLSTRVDKSVTELFEFIELEILNLDGHLTAQPFCCISTSIVRNIAEFRW